MRSAWLALAAAGVALSLACEPRVFARDPSTSGDSPALNRATSRRQPDVPLCPGGSRALLCAFGENCRVTQAGCQVCQCLSPP